jgi:hypothetical protein
MTAKPSRVDVRKISDHALDTTGAEVKMTRRLKVQNVREYRYFPR